MSIRKKILIDVERLRYPHTGLANVCENLMKGISAEIDLDVDIYYFGPKRALSNLPDSVVVEYKKWHKFYECFSRSYDIIHSTHQLTHYFCKTYKHTKKILTLHDLNFLYEEGDYTKALNIVNRNLQNTDYLVCISNFVRNDILKNKELLNLNNVKEIVVIHNGIQFPDKQEYSLEKYPFLKDKKYILNIGVIAYKKNQKALVQMLPFIEEDLVIVSSSQKDSYYNDMWTIAKDLGVVNRIHILSHISEEDKKALIANSQAMCHPSLAEGFGIPPIEAMTFGKSVFLSRYTSLPEIGGEVAFYFDSFTPEAMAKTFKDGMQTYLSNKQNYSNRLQQWASQFDYRVMTRNYLQLYQRI